MPQPSPQLHLPHLDDSTRTSKPSRRTTISAPNNEPPYPKMNVRKLLDSIPERQRGYERCSEGDCKLRARKGYDPRNGRSVMVFKRTGPGKMREPCGMPDCKTCGVFWKMDMDDLERSIPGLVPDQPCTPTAREAVFGPSAPSTTGSTTSTLTEFTEISEISQELLGQASGPGILTPSSTCSSVTLYASSAPSTTSTPTKPPKDGNLHRPYDLPSPASSTTLADVDEDSASFRGGGLPASSSISTLTEFTEHSRRSSMSTASAAPSSSAMSTLTEFSELNSSSSVSTAPSSFSSVPPTLSTNTTLSTSHPYKVVKVKKHRAMIEMSDGSAWVPPTLERIQAYISSQGERRLAPSHSARLVVASHAHHGSTVAMRYEKAIAKVDRKVGIEPETRREILLRWGTELSDEEEE